MNGDGSIRFSLVVAVHNVERYLADFIYSVDTQTFPLDGVQVVMVDDGSTDGSLVVLEQWAARRPGRVTVVTKGNGGQGSARNLGLEYVLGEWVGCPDPDDLLDRGYLQRVDEFLRDHGDVAMVATNRIVFDEQSGEQRDAHPLRRMFSAGDRAVDVDRFGEYFHGTASAAFFRTDIIAREGLRFDERIRPNFEDGHFCCRYLLATTTPVIGFVASARYIYRKRADGTSTLQTALTQPGRFLAVPRHGYLDILRRAARSRGEPPEWLQNFVLYELSHYFSADATMASAGSAAHGQVAEQFVRTLGEIAALLRPEIIDSCRLRRLDRVRRDILLHAFGEDPWVTPYAVITKTDPERDVVQVAYRFVGDAPEEKILIRGVRFTPRHAKVRDHVFWDHALLHERLAWVPASGTLRIVLNGRPVDIRDDWPESTIISLRPAQRDRMLGLPSADPAATPRPDVRGLAVRWLARSWPARRVFGHAWVLVDRLHNADDNAERLFRYLRRRKRTINAWFVIEADTPGWRRLRADGYRRLIPYGSLRWELLMLNCRHLISSHIDEAIVSPPRILSHGEPRWRFTFLQHGVIKDDISRWLNRKSVDLFVTSTPMEHASIVADNTPYAVTSLETKMTGLPRFDRLLDMGSRVSPERRDLLLVCPTWRHWLVEPLEPGSQRRHVSSGFLDSDFLRQWLAFLGDERLRALATRERLRIGFLPHPNLQTALPSIRLPEHVTPLRFDGEDVQQMIAHAAVLVTDYSSMAFNAAYVERPVVYFQFDADAVMGGGHTGRYGYFDYHRHGFGPVAESLDAAISATEDVVANGRTPTPEYLGRIRATFPDRDGHCCARTVAAIAALDRPVRA